MISKEKALKIAKEWVDSWNSHDLERIMEHYADKIEHTTPFAENIPDKPSGALRGKEEVGKYFRAGLERIPDLKFELIDAFLGVNSITILYKAVFGKTATETLFLDSEGKVIRSVAHYNEI